MKLRTIITVTIVLGAVITGCSKRDEPTASTSDEGSGSAGGRAVSEGVWLTDFEAAKAKAAEEGRDLLVDFSGSDWCYWCKRLNGEVFSKPGFVDKAGENFVFVKIDFPSDQSRQSSALRAQNRRLSRIYGIQGYPTVLLIRPDGTPYAETGYREGGPDAYLEHLSELQRQR